MKFYVMIFGLLIAPAAFAQWDLLYQGTGEMTTPYNPTEQCALAQLTLRPHEPGTVSEKLTFNFTCLGHTLGPILFEKVGNDLVLVDPYDPNVISTGRVGTMTKDRLQFELKYSKGGMQNISIAKLGDQLSVNRNVYSGDKLNPGPIVTTANLRTSGRLKIDLLNSPTIQNTYLSIPNGDGTSRLVVPNWTSLRYQITNLTSEAIRVRPLSVVCEGPFIGLETGKAIDIPGGSAVQMPLVYVDMISPNLNSVQCEVDFRIGSSWAETVGISRFTATK